MAARVHGWRKYRLFNVMEGTNVPTLIGNMGVRLHSAQPPSAVCTGFTNFQDWLDDDVKAMPKEEQHPEGAAAPQLNCTCGYYLHRLWPEDESPNYPHGPTIFAHVTCIGRTVLHTEGARTAAYQIDYIIPPPSVDVALGESYLVHEYGPPEREKIPLVPLVEKACSKLQIPLIPFYDKEACPECIIANKEEGREPSWEEGRYGYAIGIGPRVPMDNTNVDNLPDVLGESLPGTDLYAD